MSSFLRKGGPAAATVLGVCAVLLSVASVQAGESNAAAAESSNEPTADLPGAVADDGDHHCEVSETNLCLLDGIYEVSIALGSPEHFEAEDAPPSDDWETCESFVLSGRVPEFPCHAKVVMGGSRVIGTDESGLFYFFTDDNWEVLIKVLDGCTTPLPNHWVYAATASDQGMRILVRDTTWTEEAGAEGRLPERVWTFRPVADTRRARELDESEEDYQRNVLAKGHQALTASDAFPFVCEEPAAASDVADAGGEVDPEGSSAGSP